MDIKNIAASGVLLAVGFAFGASALTSLEIGTAFRMGPGYFPLILSGIIVALGLLIGVRALATDAPFHKDIAPSRALAFILLAPILFGLTVRGLGFIPAVALTALTAAAATDLRHPVRMIAIAVSITLFCTIVFHYGLGLPVRLLGPWIGA
ncbi:tripartite tricarboxylate transporter TctB family protein [Sinorhizobium sp. KGO-5]|uniref:tripartite tricarboxylate transporter TctB family protein n=1 Tax=Sinorhizobium sp. KGO-5 TaxID=1470810 RepID=UPI0029498845|nr:tripartite tricarboxylate transporter TctB family protein [Sinorhizobium sp. KGO-5]